MGEQRSPNGTNDLVSAFHEGWRRHFSNQMASIRSGQDQLHAKTDRHLVLTGQVLEAIRAMGKPTQAPPSGLMQILAMRWSTLQELSKRFELAHKLWRILVWSRVVLWPAYIIGGLKWLGWLG
jgi:hypothetical protein